MQLLTMSFQSSFLISTIWMLRKLAGNYLPKRILPFLWGTALIRMLIPVNWISPLSFYRLFPATNLSPQTPISQSWSWNLWLVGVLLIASWFLFRNFLLLRQLEGANDLPNFYWKSPKPMRRTIRICRSNAISTPMAVGILRPRILLPTSWDMQAPDTGYVLAHEFFHIFCLDGLWKLLALAAACLHWFNPLAWLLLFCLNRDLELACDERVLSHFGWGRTVQLQYAASLLAQAAINSGISLTESHYGKHPLEERLNAIMKRKKANPRNIFFTAITVLTLTAVFATTPPPTTLSATVPTPYYPAAITAEPQISNSPAEKCFKLLKALRNSDLDRTEREQKRMIEIITFKKENTNEKN